MVAWGYDNFNFSLSFSNFNIGYLVFAINSNAKAHEMWLPEDMMRPTEPHSYSLPPPAKHREFRFLKFWNSGNLNFWFQQIQFGETSYFKDNFGSAIDMLLLCFIQQLEDFLSSLDAHLKFSLSMLVDMQWSNQISSIFLLGINISAISILLYYRYSTSTYFFWK